MSPSAQQNANVAQIGAQGRRGVVFPSAPRAGNPQFLDRFFSVTARTIGGMGALKLATIVRRAVKTARADARWTPDLELTAALATRVAARLDANPAAVGEEIRLIRELRSLLAELPGGRAEKGGDDDEQVGAGPLDPVDAELAAIVGAGASVGDTPHA